MFTRRLAVLVVAALVAACGSDSPNQPTQQPPAQTQTYTLNGGITESAPTTSNKVPGAVVAFTDGANAGKTATTDGAGNFSIPGLQSGGFTIRVTATGYEDASRPVSIPTTGTFEVPLTPIRETLQNTYGDTLSGGDITCSDGTFQKPCKTVTMNIHHAGAISGILEWSNSSNDLDLTLWRGSTMIADSKAATGRIEIVTSSVQAGFTYQFRVTYYGGSTIQPFTLRVTRPN